MYTQGSTILFRYTYVLIVTEAKMCFTNLLCLTGWMKPLSAFSVTLPEDNCSEGDATKLLDSVSQPLFAFVDKQSEP